jgi:hypothetical protein
MLKTRSHKGTAKLDAVLCLAVAFPIAAGLYWILEEGLEMFFLTMGTSVGWPI